jgi:hypothetical protein
MKALFTVDPGVRASGWALFKNGELDSCGLAENELGGTAPPHEWLGAGEALLSALERVADRRAAVEVAAECMVMRRENLAAVGDLLALNAIVGVLFGAVALRFDLPEYRVVYPRDWTGMRPKAVNHQRIFERLSSEEKAALVLGLQGVSKSHKKEVLDAVGIGLYCTERL